MFQHLNILKKKRFVYTAILPIDPSFSFVLELKFRQSYLQQVSKF